MIEYIPISLNSLKSDTVIGCNIYILTQKDGDSNYVLYCKGDTLFESQKKNLLMRNNVNRLFIKREDKKHFSLYLESNFQKILSYYDNSPAEKARIIRDTATNLVRDLFEDPRTGNIERTKMFAYNMVDCVIKDPRTADHLIKMASNDYYAYRHSVNVAAIGTLFADSLGFKESELKPFCLGVLLRDIGQTKISNTVLDKRGKLTKEEFDKVREHPELGVSIISREVVFKDDYKITLQHHENCDGSGYPHGLKKEGIHPFARIVRIVDVYDALTTDRPYAEALVPFEAVKKIASEMWNVMDISLLKEFIKFLGGHS